MNKPVLTVNLPITDDVLGEAVLNIIQQNYPNPLEFTRRQDAAHM